MPRASVDAETGGNDPVRVCAECRRAKTIRGVWYLVPGRAPSPFVCEACFATHGSLRALS
ncbi:MAG TPA: hypothetical protein VFH78_05605 [Candidatus Thermoplasmatota archaeon]|nr:hypothetical protein [Candidatus Thermoplasmatota archaeon]